jgi:site-specific recombinase XerD
MLAAEQVILPMNTEKPPQLMSFVDTQALFCRALQARNASPRTVEAYTKDVAQFFSWLQGEIDVDMVTEVQREDIEAFLAYLGSNGSTGTSRRRKLCALRRFFACMVEHGYIERDPTQGVARPKAEEHTPEILYRHEYKALLYEARDNLRDQAILQVFLQTGIRVGELCSLTLNDVDLKARELTIRQGKGLRDRVIPLTDEATQALEQFLAVRAPSDIPNLFLTKYGTALGARAANYMLQKYVCRAGIRKHISIHNLRHTCATHRADKGMPLRSLQAMLGHRSLETTYRYLHLARSSLRQEVEATAL